MDCGAAEISHIPGAEHTALHECSCLEADKKRKILQRFAHTRKDGLHQALGHACGPGESIGPRTIGTEYNKFGCRIHGENDQHHCEVRELSIVVTLEERLPCESASSRTRVCRTVNQFHARHDRMAGEYNVDGYIVISIQGSSHFRTHAPVQHKDGPRPSAGG
jgi:hypothetical protein